MSLAREVLKAKKQEIVSQIADLRKGLRDIEAALEILDPPSGGEGKIVPGDRQTVNEAILWAVHNGNGTPAEIYNFITNEMSVETSKNSVSTRLSKMKNEGLLEHDGERWIVPLKTKAPDVDASEAFEELGPVTGRGRVFPATPPEGSIPSGSTDVQTLKAGVANVLAGMPSRKRELDDEIPF